jgi:integrase
MAHIEQRKRTTKNGVTKFWFAQVYVGRHPGTKKPQLLSKTFATEKEAKVWVRAQETLKDKGTPPSVTKQTFADYLRDWLKVHKGQTRAVTIYSYESMLRRWIFEPPKGTPLLGSIQLKVLTTSMFSELYAQMREQDISPRGCQYLHAIVHKAFEDAIEAGLLSTNPAQRAKVPKQDHSKDDDDSVVQALDQQQTVAFLRESKSEPRYSALFHVLALGGLRPCEAFALKWPDIDFEAGKVRVTQSLSRIGLDRKLHPLGWILTKPKTKGSRRTVSLPPVAIGELKAWRTLHKRERFALGEEWQDFDFVFVNELGGPLDLTTVSKRAFNRVMKRAGLGEYGPEPVQKGKGPPKQRPFDPCITIYGLRHTFATSLLAGGVPLKIVSEALGHASITLTANTYSHVIGDMGQVGADALETMYGGHRIVHTRSG